MQPCLHPALNHPAPAFDRLSFESGNPSVSCRPQDRTRLAFLMSCQSEDALNKILSAAIAVCCLLGSSALAQDNKDVAAARNSAEQWLKLVDAEDYSGAWNASSSDVRTNTPKFAWTMVVNAAHLPLGAFKSRRLTSAVPKAGGKQLTLEYASAFANENKVSETVSLVHEKDGVWRVTGYGVHAH